MRVVASSPPMILGVAVFLLFAMWPVSLSFQLNDAASLRTSRHFLAASVASADINPPNHDLVYLRWNKENKDNRKNTWKMETAVTTFQRGDTVLDLHAQLHFADAEYFDFYNQPEFSETLDHVLYELLVDRDLLEYDTSTRCWRVKAPIMASPSDQGLANSYGWTCQASQVDYTQPKWVHADWTRQEFINLVEKEKGKKNNKYTSQQQQKQQQQQPLWKLALPNPQASSTAAEAVSALLVGPPQLSYSQALGGVKRRLFTNLFLPGSQLANALRAILWMTVPAPELSIILLDWSSLLTPSRSSSGRSVVDVEPNPSALNEVAWPIFSSLAKLDLASMRRFFFGQVLVSSNSNSKSADHQDQAWSLLVTKRNDRALDTLRNILKENNGGNDDPKQKVHSALLYGSSHCPDLHTKLVADGFTPVKTTWRTAWSVEVQAKSFQDDKLTLVPVLTLLLIAYLVVGALDWVGMMRDVSQVMIERPMVVEQEVAYLDATVAAGFYLIRHVLFYLGFSKFLVDWTNINQD